VNQKNGAGTPEFTMVWALSGAPAEAELISLANAGGIEISRRCTDAPELLSVCAVVPGTHVLVSAQLPRMSSEIFAILTQQVESVSVITFDDHQEALARSWNAGRILRADQPGFDLVFELRRDLLNTVGVPEKKHEHTADDAEKAGQVIACWGPPGSHGRTTFAIGLAEALGKCGARVLLIDADTVAPSVALTLGIHEDVSGIVVAARYAEANSLDSRSLANCVRAIAPNFWVMTGLSDPSRWPEVRAGAMEKVVARARDHFDHVVIDLGAGLDELDSELGINLAPTLVPRRTVVTRTVLENSDQVFLTTRADALGAQRLATTYSNHCSLFVSARRCVVVNMVRKAEAHQIQREFGEICAALDPALEIRYLPSDTVATDMVKKASTLGELHSRGALAKAIGECALALLREREKLGGRKNVDRVTKFSPLVQFLSSFRIHPDAPASSNR
jgi:MinD-like ATPase involved in chromosome partitioning or flagellar assembly